MYKIGILKTLVIFIFFGTLSHAQDFGNENKIEQDKLNDEKTRNEIRESLSDEEFSKALTAQLSVLLSGQETNTLGSFAAVDIVDAEVKFSPSFVLKNGNLVTAELKAGVTDGFSPIFSNNKLNTNISFEVALNLGNPYSRKSLSFNGSEWKVFKGLKKALEIERNQKILETDEFKLDIDLKISELEAAIKKNEELIEKESNTIEEKSKIIAAKSLDSLKIFAKEKERIQEKDKLKLATLDFEIKSLKVEIKNYDIQLSNFKNYHDRIQLLRDKNAALKRQIISLVNQKETYNSGLQKELIDSEYVKKFKELKEKYKLKITGVELDWYSISYKIRNDALNLFDSSLEFNEQVEKLNEVSHEFNFQYSKYVYSKVPGREMGKGLINYLASKPFFWSLGLSFAFTNNLEELDKIEVVDTTVETSNGVDRSSQEKINAYIGPIDNDIKRLNLFTDLYYFLYKNKFAVHLYPIHRIQNERKPQTDFTIGLLFSFKNPDKEQTSPVNVEAFYNFLDLFENSDTDLSLFERNNIGLRFTFPINFR